MKNSTRFTTFASLTLAGLALSAASTANAAIWVRSRIVVRAPLVVPVVAPVVITPVVAAAAVATPVVLAPVVVAPVCAIVSVPFVNAYTGVTYLVPRRVCR